MNAIADTCRHLELQSGSWERDLGEDRTLRINVVDHQAETSENEAEEEEVEVEEEAAVDDGLKEGEEHVAEQVEGDQADVETLSDVSSETIQNETMSSPNRSTSTEKPTVAVWANSIETVSFSQTLSATYIN